MTTAVEPTTAEPKIARRRLRPNATWLLALPVLFNLWVLRAETRVVENLNDGSVHIALIRAAGRSFANWRIPLDGWFPFLQTGSPAFHEYQTFPHIVTGFFARFVGAEHAYSWSLYLLLALWPIAVYAGARLLGWRMRGALAAAFVASLVANLRGYGFEFGSYTFAGLGVWSQLWAMWLLPLSLGLTWRAVDRGRSPVLAAVVLSLTIVSHIITGYFALIALGVWVLARGSQGLGQRIKRGVGVGIGSLIASSWLLVPVLVDRRWVVSLLGSADDFRRNSYGLRQVLAWLFTGRLFDAGFEGPRFPLITILVFVGIVMCIIRFRADVRSRALLGLWVVSLVLYAGRPTFGFLLDRLPGADVLIFHRFILAVHLTGILLAGVGGSFIIGLVIGVLRAVGPRLKPAVVGAVATALAVAALTPAWTERAAYGRFDADLMGRQESAQILDGGARRSLIALAKNLGDGRVYSGFPNNWGKTYVVGYVPGYSSLLNHDADGIGFTYRVPSILSNIEAFMNERNGFQLNLFGVRYLLLPRGQAPPVTAEPLDSQGRHVLWEVPTSGYFALVDTIDPIEVSSTREVVGAFGEFLASEDLRRGLYPTVAFRGAAAGRPTVDGSDVPEGSPGSVTPGGSQPARGIFRVEVDADRTAAVMLKASYHGRWRVTVDGREASKYMVAPGFPAVTVNEGVHTIEFRYMPVPDYPWLFAFTVLGLFALYLAMNRDARRRWLSRFGLGTRARTHRPAEAPSRAAEAQPAGSAVEAQADEFPTTEVPERDLS